MEKTNKQGKEPKRRHKSQITTCFHTQESHKTTKLEAKIHTSTKNLVFRHHSCRLSLFEFIGALIVLIERLLFSWCPPSLLGFVIFPFPPLQGSLSSEEGFSGDVLFSTKCFTVSHTVHNVWLWISTVIYVLCRRKFL